MPLEDESDEFRENVNVIGEQLPREMTLDQYTDQAQKMRQKMMTDYEKIDDQHVQLGEREAAFVEFTHRMGQVRVHATQYCLVDGERAYFITNSAEPGRFDQHRDKFEQVVATFSTE